VAGYRCPIADGAGTDTRLNDTSSSERIRSVVASFGEWPSGVIRFGVVLCVGLALAVVIAGAYRDALEGSDFWADRHSGSDYATRSVPNETAIGSKQVAEDARLWMPEDATYRIVASPDLEGPLEWAAPDFLAGFLLPRRQTDSEDAEWVFCYLCDTAELGDQFETLSDGGNGVLFGRMRP